MTMYMISEENLSKIMNALAELPYKSSNPIIGFMNQTFEVVPEPEAEGAEEA